MSEEDLQCLYCIVLNYKSAVDDVDFIDSWRFVDFQEKYLNAAPKILNLLKQLKETNNE